MVDWAQKLAIIGQLAHDGAMVGPPIVYISLNTEASSSSHDIGYLRSNH